MSTALQTLTAQLATKLEIGGDSKELVGVLKATVFKGPATDEQLTALMIVANQYGLNPWTKEIYAFPDKNNGIVPVVGIDGWMRIINEHPSFDGMEVKYSEQMVTLQGAKPSPEWCEITFYRKDRSRPITIREYLDEVYQAPRGNFSGPWQTHTKRFLRHKALIQGARVAFGFGGIKDEDEAERILEKDVTPQQAAAPAATQAGHDVDKVKLQSLQAAASAGDMDHLSALWAKELSREDRKALGAEYIDKLKSICEAAAAAKVIDAEYSEVAE